MFVTTLPTPIVSLKNPCLFTFGKITEIYMAVGVKPLEDL